MRIALGADHRGFELKERLKHRLAARGHTVLDFGTDSVERVDYPGYAFKVARAVQSGKVERGVLVCSTGIGMSIAANRFPKVRAALASSVRLAILSRQHNGSNVLCLGADFLSRAKVSRIVDAWLGAEFAGGRHTRRVRQLGRALKA